MEVPVSPAPLAKTAEVALDRDVFMRTLIRELAGTLEHVIGVEDASGYISVVGATVGESIDGAYRKALHVAQLDRQQVSEVLVDLKRRIAGDFYIIEATEERLVLGNRACPFGDKVVGRTSMCMMTSNVFGHIAAQNLGYAHVALEQTIARGDRECRVVVHFQPTDTDGREYFQTP
jgi:predicted ArsR family transcriptional regulator